MQPDQFTQIPVLVKIFKLIVNELSNNLIDALASDSESEESGDDWEDEDLNGMEHSNQGNRSAIELSKLLDHNNSIYQDEDDEEDPDALHDPIYTINLKQYLTEFLSEFCKQPYYLTHFAAHLTVAEKGSLASIGIQQPN